MLYRFNILLRYMVSYIQRNWGPWRAVNNRIMEAMPYHYKLLNLISEIKTDHLEISDTSVDGVALYHALVANSQPALGILKYG